MQQRVRTSRLDTEVFELPVEKMREGYYTDAYFNHTRQVLLQDGRHPRVVMQVFQKRHSYLGGVDEAIAVLKLCADDWEDLTVHALHDGDALAPYEPVLTIEGDYTGFAHLETVYLGVLARRMLITTNVLRVLEAAAEAGADWLVLCDTNGGALPFDVEDAVRGVARELLSLCGYTVLEARNGREGLTMAREHPGPIHLLLTDVVMPGMNGRVLADEAQKRLPGLKVLYMTGYSRNAIVHHGRLDSGVHLIEKPVAVDQLAGKLRSLLDG